MPLTPKEQELVDFLWRKRLTFITFKDVKQKKIFQHYRSYWRAINKLWKLFIVRREEYSENGVKKFRYTIIYDAENFGEWIAYILENEKK